MCGVFIKIKRSVMVAGWLSALYLAVSASVAWAEPVHWQTFKQLQHAGLLLTDNHGNVLQAKAANQGFIPASTTKLVTAYLALQHWGAEHRFKTGFYVQGNTLWVKGYGDPYLVSEELARLAKPLASHLRALGVVKLEGVRLDTSYYSPGLVMPGTGETDNPYDAIPAVLAANFNTINVQKKAGTLHSAEPQTPLTSSGLYVANTIVEFKEGGGTRQRVNLGKDSRLAERYFAEQLAYFLTQEGLQVASVVQWQTLPQTDDSYAGSDIKPVYEHYNSLTLAQIVRPMMQYSTNFIANQLALNLSAERLGAPASQEKIVQLYQQTLHQQFGWQNFTIEEGAGLSRQNQLTPQQLIQLLNAFKPWRELLPQVVPNVYAKSGTLMGVSSLAGYIKQPNNEWWPFAFMINQPVAYAYRNQLAQELSRIK
jgi:D-alanyl-D-alanine carboxypeptidase/D-alanyl-D-alanine-endopeptidase (penicillin-binding protein 4)